MPPLRASRRFRLMLWAPGVAAALAAAGVMALLAPGLLRQGVSEALLAALDVLAPLVARNAHLAPAERQAWLVDLAGQADVRITLVDRQGRVVADSARDQAGLRRMDNHLDRPEVRAALATGSGSAVRRSATTGTPYVYAARRLYTADGEAWVVRVAQPLEALDAVYRHLLQALLVALLCAGLAVAGVAAWFRRRVLAPFLGLVNGSEQLARELPGRRVEEPPVDELAHLARSLNRMAERVEEQVTAKEAERRRLEEILDGMGEGVLVTGASGEPVFANPAFRELLALPAGVATGQLLELLRKPRVDELLRRALRGADWSVDSGAAEELAVAGRTLALASRPLGVQRGALLVVRDLSATERAARSRRDFVANVSHELKTPLAVIRAAAETLADHARHDPEAGADEPTTRFAGRILEQSLRLQDLLEDLLTLARLESPEAAARRRPVDLRAVVARAVELATPLAEAREVSLALRLEEVSAIEGDEPALERLALNLLDNAVKYNRPGGWVEVRLAPSGDAVVLEVADGGVGIPVEELPRVFERFYRVDKARGRAEGGSGLGLAIVKHVAENHGGRVEVESAPGAGSRFRVRLPALPRGHEPSVPGPSLPTRGERGVGERGGAD
jgi:two-component system phosphate regulon sensor histidine kinase PhoR